MIFDEYLLLVNGDKAQKERRKGRLRGDVRKLLGSRLE
tara:strand:- start:239 stop:352 length:114 start_codon:yes stop_codon:yes gene_type:complete